MDNEKNTLNDSELENVGEGHTVKGDDEICDRFEPISYCIGMDNFHCRHCIHFVLRSITDLSGKCSVK